MTAGITGHGHASRGKSASPGNRDLRIDFFRGIALLCIFVDHIPGNVVSRLTLHSFGFSDAAELFVLLGGVSAALAYGHRLDAVTLILKRVARIYLAQVSLVLVVAAVLAFAVQTTGNEVLASKSALAPFLAAPADAVRRTLLLTLQPEFIDILPLYMVLLLWLPILLRIAKASSMLALAGAFGLWLVVNIWHINLPGHRDGGWYFNPLAWQLTFTIGVVVGLRGSAATGLQRLPRMPVLLWTAGAFLVFSFILSAPWAQFPVPALRQFHPLPADLLGHSSKTFEGPWRIVHILCLAYVTAWFVPRETAWLESGWALRIRRIGRNSLKVFVLASVLSYVASIVFVLVGKSLAVQLVCNVLGLTLLATVGNARSAAVVLQDLRAMLPQPVFAFTLRRDTVL